MQGAGSARKPHIQAVARDFNTSLYRGKEWEWKVFRFLKTRFPDMRPPLTYEEAIGRVDPEPDLSVRGLPVQCKRRDFEFRDGNDYPYPTVFIDEDYKLRSDYLTIQEYMTLPLEEKRQNLRQFMAYFIASESMENMGVVIPGTKHYWTQRKVALSRDGRDSTTWEVPVSKVLWLPVSRWREILTRV